MNSLEFAAHLVGVLHGVGACLACYTLFYICGLGLMPRAWDADVRGDSFPAILGAAAFVLWCWYGIKLNVPLARLIVLFVAAVAVLIFVRFRRMRAAVAIRIVNWRLAAGWVSVFAALYLSEYVFFAPSVSAEYLPPAWLGNPDLLNYANITQYVLRLGPSNISGFSFMDFVYLQTPAAFSLLGLLSMLFGQDLIQTAMPALYAVAGLIGVTVARISQSVFSVSRPSAFAIAAILISGPFFRYVAGNYFLASLVATPMVLYLVWITATAPVIRPLTSLFPLTRLCALYLLLLFTYPVMLVVGVAAQLGTIGLLGMSRILTNPDERRMWRAHAGGSAREVVRMLAAVGVVVLCAPLHVWWVLALFGKLSRLGVAGWPLDLISPLSLFGVPGSVVHVPVDAPADRAWAMLGFCLLSAGVVALGLWWFRRRTTASERTLIALAAGSMVAYCIAFSLLGPSYQQWKIASYLPLPLSFILSAALIRLWHLSSVGAFFDRSAWRRRGAAGVWAAGAFALVAGNAAVHATAEPPQFRLSGSLRNLEQLEGVAGVGEMYVQMGEPPANTFLAVYFIRNKQLHLISRSYYPVESLPRERISLARPLLIQTDAPCERIARGTTVTIPEVGCLLAMPPTPTLDESYRFANVLPFVAITGLSYTEQFGRWNDGENVQLDIQADAQQFPVEEVGYVNLLVRPYLPSATSRQRLILDWGTSRHAEDAVAAREWLSLAVRPGDWVGERFKTLRVTMNLPDAIAPATVDPRSSDSRRLAVAFEEMSIRLHPRGRTIPRSVTLDTSYPFNRENSAVETSGLYPAEAWGRWGRDAVVRLTLTAEGQQLPVAEPLYVNMLVRPFLPPGVRTRKMAMRWGAGRQVTGALAAREWISLPLRIVDWTGSSPRSLTISIDLPGAIAPHSVDPRSGDERPLAVGFEQVLISTRPRGRNFLPAAGSGR